MSLRARKKDDASVDMGIFDDIEGGRKSPSFAKAYAGPSEPDFTGVSPIVIVALVMYLGVTFYFCSEAEESEILIFVMVLCSAAFFVAYLLLMFVMAKDDGTPEMKEVVTAIREGSFERTLCC
jgi:hypothetical protein